MKAAVFHDHHDVRIEDVPDPPPAPGELLVRVAAVGICGTDAHEYASGPHMFPITHPHPVSGHVGPMIPGHELAGVVVAAGPNVTGFDPGTLIVSGAGISCGHCHWCRRGRTNLCQSYSTLGLHQNGALAQYVPVPAATCVNADTYGLTSDTAALGQPMSIAVHAMRRGRLAADEVAIVLGVGGIGAFLTYATAQLAHTVVVADLDPDRLKIAEELGAKHTVQIGGDNTVGDILTAHNLIPSVIYEVSGTPVGLHDAVALAPRGCRIVLVGLQDQPAEFDVRDLSLREIEVIGTNAHVVGTDLPEALRLLAARDGGWTDIAPMALSLDHLVDDGLQPLAERRSHRIKTLIDPWAETSRTTLA